MSSLSDAWKVTLTMYGLEGIKHLIVSFNMIIYCSFFSTRYRSATFRISFDAWSITSIPVTVTFLAFKTILQVPVVALMMISTLPEYAKFTKSVSTFKTYDTGNMLFGNRNTSISATSSFDDVPSSPFSTYRSYDNCDSSPDSSTHRLTARWSMPAKHENTTKTYQNMVKN